MAYGTDANIQYLVWGGTKASTPAIVTKANQVMTSMINASLGLSADMSPTPDIIRDICELGAAGIVKQETPDTLHPWTKQALEMLNFYKNDLKSNQIGNWGNVRIVNIE